MRVLLVSPYYSPDLAPDAPLFEMLLTDLMRKGHQVSVICALPHYPTGRVPKEFRGRLTQHELRNGVDVTRVWIPSVNRARLGQRLLAVLIYQLLAGLLVLVRRFDVMFTINPAFESGLPLLIAGSLRRKAIIYAAWDIYPDVGVRLGIFRHRFVVKAVAAIEAYCYRHSSFVHVLSDGHRRLLIERGVPAGKLALIPLWVDTDFIKPVNRQNELSSQHGLDDFFVVLYAGNLGKTHGAEHLLETARVISSEPTIRLVLVGEGEAHAKLQRAFERDGLTNGLFIHFQPRERLPLLLGCADVSLVMLRPGFGADSVPSKAYPILASGRPLLAAVDRESETCRLVERSACGLCVEPGNPRAIAGAILQLYRNEQLRTELGKSGRAHALKHHSRDSASRKFHLLLSSLLGIQKAAHVRDPWAPKNAQTAIREGTKEI